MLLRTMRIPIIAVACLLVPLVIGCEDKPAPAKPPATRGSALKVKCPLCVNHEIEVDDKTPRTDHDGQTYYFCSEACRERFLQDPAKFIARARARAAATRPSAN